MDRHFDALGLRLAKNIYGSYKGQLRLALLREDLADRIHTSDRILDVGAGLAQLSADWVMAGSEVCAFDAAPAMQQAAERYIYDTFGLSWGKRYQVARLQDYAARRTLTYDWVFCHAVLAWLVDPAAALRQLAKWCCPGGHLSLLVFNKDSIALQQVFRGRYDYLARLWERLDASPDRSGSQEMLSAPALPFYPGGLTPQTPLDRLWVQAQLHELGFDVVFEAGVRCFSDYLVADVRERLSFEQLLQMERVYRHQMPFLGMARFIHVIARKRSTTS